MKYNVSSSPTLDEWKIYLKPSQSSMILVRPEGTYSIALDCTGSLISGVYTKYFGSGIWKVAVHDTRYVLSFHRDFIY